ncbi:hypothetical protein Golomagni_02254 [Golovinomyces magnicellulatus]|nr:hypothetical protein Golomagni_02254 [Golovinomyces magnicellulatus]
MGGSHILVCSIGNPAPYARTLHSAGHVVLSALATMLSYKFEKAQSGGGSLVSVGAAVAKASKIYGGRKLVVLHDELELPLGRVKVTSGHASAKGHNGLRSMMTKDYIRIGIGIDRPLSREPDVVAAYVLRKMKGNERIKIEASAFTALEELRKL